MLASRRATVASALRTSIGAFVPTWTSRLVLARRSRPLSRDWPLGLQVLDGVDEVPVGRFDVVDRFDEDVLELAPGGFEAVLGDEDLPAADGPAEVLEQGLGQGEIQPARIGRIVVLEELIRPGPGIVQAHGQIPPERDLLKDGEARVRGVLSVYARFLEGPGRGLFIAIAREIELDGRRVHLLGQRDLGRGQAGIDDLGGDVEVVLEGPDDRVLEGQGELLRLLAEAEAAEQGQGDEGCDDPPFVHVRPPEGRVARTRSFYITLFGRFRSLRPRDPGPRPPHNLGRSRPVYKGVGFYRVCAIIGPLREARP